MQKILLGLAVFLVLHSPFDAHGALYEQDRAQVERGRNELSNGGFEASKAAWTASGGTLTTTSAAANKFQGNASGSWDSGAAAQTLDTAAVSITSGGGLSGINGAASCYVKCATGSCTHKLQVVDGSANVLSEASIASVTSSFVPTTVNFVGPSSGSVKLRLVSVAADEPIAYVDSCYLGPAKGFNLADVNQAQFVGSAKTAGTANCRWSDIINTMGPFLLDNDCPTPVLVGSATAPATKVPAIVFSTLMPGEYEVRATGWLQARGTFTCLFRINDGATSSGGNGLTNDDGGNVTARFRYTTAQSNVTFQMYSAGGDCRIDNTDTDGDFEISVYRYPLTSELVHRPDLLNWRVEAGITGGDPNLGTAVVAAYTGIANSSLTLANTGTVTAQIPCSSTNPSTGATCAAGDEQLGVAFYPPTSGLTEVCAEFQHNWQYTGGVSNRIDPTFKIVRTANNSQTILESAQMLSHFYAAGAFGTGTSPFGADTHRTCADFDLLSTADLYTFRLFYTQDSLNALTSAISGTSANKIRWTVRPRTQNIPAVNYVGSVTSVSTGQERVERARVASACVSSPCTISSQSGAFTSITRSATGVYSANITAGVFSSAPVCVAQVLGGNGPNVRYCGADTTSSTVSTIECFSTLTTAADNAFNLICMGPR